MKKVFFSVFACLVCILLAACKSAPQEPAAEAPAVEPVVEEAPVAEEPVQEDYTAQKDELQQKIKDARQKSLDAGAADVFAGNFPGADEAASKLSAGDESLDFDAYKANVKKALDLYKAYEKAALAYKAYTKILQFEFENNDPENFEKGQSLYAEFAELANANEDSALMLEKAEGALAAYTAVLDSSFKKLADSEREKTVAAKRDADSIKASVAGKKDYEAAEKHMTDGDAAYSRMSWENSWNLYKDATAGFTEVYRVVSEKRAYAAEQIEKARKRTEEVASFAEQADEIAPLPESAEDEEDAEDEEIEAAAENEVPAVEETPVVEEVPAEVEETPAEPVVEEPSEVVEETPVELEAEPAETESAETEVVVEETAVEEVAE